MRRHFLLALATTLLIGCGQSGDSGDLPIEVPPELQNGAVASARFLTQATFGPTAAEIDSLSRAAGFEGWIQRQAALPVSLQHPYILQREAQGDTVNRHLRQDIWWRNAVRGPDQLRQRMAFALSQIFVVSDQDSTLGGQPAAVAHYYDLLATHALGNYRDLLEAVTLSPVMGVYLSMLRNRKPDPDRSIRADENYAREIMQLFSIGLVELHLDGSVRRDGNGVAIATYDQGDIENLARVFTGWSWHAEERSNSNFWGPEHRSWTEPMVAYPQFHDEDAKTIIGETFIASGLSAEQELQIALDTIFQHPNVGPFVVAQLIQRLVTSNPSPDYIARVAAVFNDNGQGVRGDLQAVATAILTDREALNGQIEDPENFGKLKEPLLRVTHFWRVFDAMGIDGRYQYTAADRHFSEEALAAPTVFNFYRPDYSRAGALNDAGLLAPEFQIVHDSSIIAATNEMSRMAARYRSTGGLSNENYNPATIVVDYSSWEALAEDPAALMDMLNLIFFANAMPAEMYQTMTDYIASIDMDTPEIRLRDAMTLILASPQFAVQR